jgi:CDP-diacylglycerol--glycerol-3-phosphate 3-phosphatidyltransferase
MPASPLAKVKTTAQLSAIALYILPLSSAWDDVKLGLLVVAVALTVWTGIQYAVRAIPWLRAPRPAPPVGDGGRA